MPELARALEAEHGVKVASLLDLAGADPRRHDVQKKSLIASERERADVRAARAD